ncbi:MAG: 3-dehydroquinate synthase [Ignavibacteriae bacterium]|nr:3-dehydroquinate synthase [Ignavibacteriota bacterium]
MKLQPIAHRSYDIAIERGALAAFVKRIKTTSSDLFIITDSNVERLHGRRVHQLLFDAGVESMLLSFPAGEGSKNMRVVNALQTQLLRHGIRRDSLVIALGGGVVGDVAGFVASTILRGVQFIQLPTTLLSQVDSSVGGKVGVDHPLGKNLIGAFHQPAAVFIDPGFLITLPVREFRNGLAEVVKIAAALDRSLFAFLERNAGSLRKNNARLLTEVIKRSVRLKARVVERDEFDKDLRKTLNLGHTFGHALESALNFRIRHGEAVAIGLVAEAAIAVRLGLLLKRDFDRLVNVLKVLGLPTTIPSLTSRKKFFAALYADKKSSGGMVRFVLMSAIGSSMIGVEVPEVLIEEQLGVRLR